MDEYINIAIGAGVVLLILSPVAFLFSVIQWRSAASKLRKTTVLLGERTASLKRVAEAAKVVFDAKKSADERVRYLESRFQGLVDVDDELLSLRETISQEQGRYEALRAQYAEKKEIYDRLAAEIAIFDERLAFAELGVYEPHFDFSDSEEYKRQIAGVRSAQKELIAAERAVVCTTTWTVNGNASKGQQMVNRNIKLTLRAFNNECDAAIANVRWNNANAMEKRIIRAHEQIGKLNESNSIVITPEFIRLKLEELQLTHEYREKLKAERDERAELTRQAREEQKLLRDMEAAQDEEARFAKLLERAKSEAERATGPKLDLLAEQLRQLERDLAEAHARYERAQAMAERTKSGYVYVISNIGSFGDSVVKIGLTRRLDPLDRVRELGDASVPFTFDVHAIIYSDDAPALERALHMEFESSRINTQNYRKEFFRASLDEVESALTRIAPGAPFFKDVEAQEYRETLARRASALSGESGIELFPATI